MRCPFCAATDTRVVDSRLAAEGAVVRRRRQCGECGARFTTHEQFEADYPLVVKRDGARVAFDPQRLRNGVERALEKRPVSGEQVDALLGRIQRQLLAYGERECASATIGGWLMDELRELDQVAYVRFASVYRSFEDVDAFRREVDRLRPDQRRDRKVDGKGG